MTAQTYTAAHRAEKERLRPGVDAGLASCTEPRCLEAEDGKTRWIAPGTPWDLAHDRHRPGHYHGPAHARCNRAEGARHGNTRRRRGPKTWTF